MPTRTGNTQQEVPRASLTRRTVLGAAGWTVPALALAVAVPAHAASGGAAIDASNVALTFSDPGGSSEFILSGFVALSAAPTAPVTVTATFTFVGTGPNTNEGLYLYGADNSGFGGSIPGWAIVLGAADDQLYPAIAFQTTLSTGQTQVPIISSYGGSTSASFMLGADTLSGGDLFYDGVLSVRFSAPGYDDVVLSRAFTPSV